MDGKPNSIPMPTTYDDFNKLGKVGRAVKKRVYPKGLSQKGIVVFNICINKKGKVIYSKINRDQTTIKDKSALQDLSTAMRQTTSLPKENGQALKKTGRP